MSHFLRSVATVLAKTLTVVAGIATILMVLHILLDVVMRTFMHRPLPGTLEIATHYYLVPITFLCLAYVELRGEHIVVEAFTHFLPTRTQRLLDSVVRVVCLATLGLFIWRTTLSAIARTRTGEYVEAVYFNLPIWPIRWVLPLSLAAFALAMFVRLLDGGQKLVDAHDDASHAEA